ncbi:hypothetical protein [Chryseobacterium caseinilyticum]|uniref:Lipoprotein n=1 Tax=Chryseobacterium caseinilyticum TaxID=2771428 RepID=A0ABR8ZCS0_9FLAO|nr:hypothetical protein [Chryseobacterium caseinilyticum]MBD8083104.1 hypothetical protein [Chryseobacterium caseinilyticum]
MKIKSILFLLCLINLTTVSCQSKSEKVNLNILNEPSRNVIGNKQTYPLKYYSFIDSLHSRVVLQENYIQDKWQLFKDKNFKLGYMDVYFNKENVVGFKGYLETDSKRDAEALYKKALIYISEDENYKQIDLVYDDPSIMINEWEFNDFILGIQYETGSKQFAVLAIYKNELSTFYDKIFDSEFLDLTKFRDKNSQIKFKELKVSPSKSDKNFYKKTINELKKEYNKK